VDGGLFALKTRIITGVVAGAAFLALLYLGGSWFSWLVYALAIIGFDEYMRMNAMGMRTDQSPGMLVVRLLGLIGLLLIVTQHTGWAREGFNLQTVIWLLLFLLFSVTVLTKNRITIDQIAYVFAGIIYMGFGFYYMIVTRLMENDGLYWTLFIFVCIWITDSGAYFSGRFLGKHLLWPAISPKKTIEGALGGVLLSIIAAVCFQIARPELLSIGHAVWLGLVIAVVGQLGDLIQSAYKRVKGIKDTGTLLPGHGGVLDRVDSWLIVFPFVQLLALLPQ
jgi:phosphatidate cytidylyltransferase